MTGSGRGGTGNAAYRRNRAILLATNDICGICGHSGARTANHIVPAKRWPRDENGRPLPGMDDLSNLEPAHGTLGAGPLVRHNRCPVCGKLCNQSLGAGRAPRPQSRDWFGDP